MSGLSRIAADLGTTGYCALPSFVEGAVCSALLDEIRGFRASGDLREAGIGRGGERRVHSEIRSDRVLWIDPLGATDAQASYLDRMEGLRADLNRELFLGLFDFEAHLACYPEGAFYRPHLDCHRDHAARVVSAILYLNRDWSEDDGGLLRLYTDRAAGVEGPFLDIVPEFGKVVLFLSAEFWHEVLPARRERYSLTGWFRKRPDIPLA
ncbi:MAG TPA: 2OG-Fe(II) oxygenase [Bacteroidia bacterium]|nr:2OG-Fe(II) oxygenase [Bacteroidia bacterium]